VTWIVLVFCAGAIIGSAITHCAANESRERRSGLICRNCGGQGSGSRRLTMMFVNAGGATGSEHMRIDERKAA